jgi:DNA repair protein RadC
MDHTTFSWLDPPTLTVMPKGLAIRERLHRHGRATLADRPTIPNTGALVRFVMPYLAYLPRERMVAVFTDSNMQVNGAAVMGEGTSVGVLCDLKALVRYASYTNASGVFLAHNHPSELPEPSPEDEALTRNVRVVLNVLGVELVDHVILSQDHYWSFADAQHPAIVANRGVSQQILAIGVRMGVHTGVVPSDNTDDTSDDARTLTKETDDGQDDEDQDQDRQDQDRQAQEAAEAGDGTRAGEAPGQGPEGQGPQGPQGRQ